MNFASLFCGLGGEHVGLKNAVAKYFPLNGTRDVHNFDAYDIDNRWREYFEKNFSNHNNFFTSFYHADLNARAPRDYNRLGAKLDFLWASPPCTEFSQIRRPDIPRKNDVQNLSQVVVEQWIKKFLPAGFAFENVPQFRNWGPLDDDGFPIAERRGEYFRQFVTNLKSIGYAVAAFELDAADFGCACNRRRLFVVGVRDEKRDGATAPTKPEPDDAFDRRIVDVFDPTLPMTPIDPTRKGGGGRRLANILRMLDAKQVKTIAYASNAGYGNSERNLLEKFLTFTRYGGYFVDPISRVYREITAVEMGDAMGFPDDFQYPAAKTRALLGVGQSVAPPVAEAVAGCVFERMIELGLTA